MNYDINNEIFIYNIRWLLSEKKLKDVVQEGTLKKFNDIRLKFFGDSKELADYKQRVRYYAKGSLIDNLASMQLKEELRYSLYKNIFFYKKNILDDILEISKYCVINDLRRYKMCNSDRISRPLITFITPKKNAEKLRYLDNQPLKYEYLTLDYSEIKNSNINDKRKTKPTFYSYNKISPKFNNRLLKSEINKDGDYFYYIPLEVKRGSGEKLKADTDRIKRDYDNDKKYNKEQQLENLKKITQQEKKVKNNPEDSQAKKDLEDLKRKQEKLIQDEIYIVSGRISKFKIEKNELGETIENDDFITDKYNLESNYYYKKLLERFKKRIEKILKISIDLDEWSFCILFSPLWCDKETFDGKYPDLAELVKAIGISSSDLNEKNILKVDKKNRKELSSFFNTQVNAYSIDVNLLYFLKSVFEQPEIKTLEYYKETGEITDFNIVFKAFKKFPEGGYWIKKIDKKKGVYYEKTEGPYTIEEAKKKVAILRNIMSFDNTESANYYSFKELVCEYDIEKEEEKSNISEYVKPENRYIPYPGARLFCLLMGYEEIIYFSKLNLTENFRKFNNHAIESGLKYITSLDYLIYYNPEIQSSIRKAQEIREILRNKKNYSASEFLWLLDAVSGKEIKKGTPPTVMPFKFLSEFQKNDKITYEGLKNMHKYIKNMECSDERMMISFKNFEDAFGEMYVNKYRNSNFDIKTEIKVGVVMDEYDDKVKKFKISRNYDKKYEISLHRFRKKLKDIKLISIENIQDCTGYLNIKFKDLKDKTWDVSKLNLISNDLFFNNEYRLTALILFLAKCFGVKNVVLDNSLRNSECKNDILYHYYHIYYVGYGNFDIFQSLGFKVANYIEYQELINQIKFITIQQFLEKYKINGKITNSVKDITLEKFCKDYINTNKCFTNDNLYIIQELSKIIEKNIKLNIFVDLDTLPLDQLEKIITN